MKQYDNKSTLLLVEPQQNLSLFTLQSNLLKIWTEKQVDKYYQTTMLNYMDNLPEAEAKREIIREHQKMLQNRSQYSRIKQYINRRQQILDVLDTVLQDENEIQYGCQVLDDLRKINLKLCQSIFDMKQSLECRGLNANSICEGYKFLFKSFQTDNQIVLNSYFKKYINFSQGYDPFFLYPYEKMQKRGVIRGTPNCIEKLFKMNISYVYRLIKAKNELLKSLSYACGEPEEDSHPNQRKKLKKKLSSTLLEESQHDNEGNEFEGSRRNDQNQMRRQGLDISDRQRDDSQAHQSNKKQQDSRANSEPKKQLKLPKINERSRSKENARSSSTKNQPETGSRVTIKKNLNEDIGKLLSRSSHLLQANEQDDEIDVYRRRLIGKKIKTKGREQAEETQQDTRRPSGKINYKGDGQLESSILSKSINQFSRADQQLQRTPRYYKKIPKMRQSQYRSRIHEQDDDYQSSEQRYARRRYRRRDSTQEDRSLQINGYLESKKFLEPLKLHKKKKIISNYKTDTNQLWKYKGNISDSSDSEKDKNYGSKRRTEDSHNPNKYVNNNNESHYNPQTLSQYNNPITHSYKMNQNHPQMHSLLPLSHTSIDRNHYQYSQEKDKRSDYQTIRQSNPGNFQGEQKFIGSQFDGGKDRIQYQTNPNYRVEEHYSNNLPYEKDQLRNHANRSSIPNSYNTPSDQYYNNKQQERQQQHQQERRAVYDQSPTNYNIKQNGRSNMQDERQGNGNEKYYMNQQQARNNSGNYANQNSYGTDNKYSPNQSPILNPKQSSQSNPARQFDNRGSTNTTQQRKSQQQKPQHYQNNKNNYDNNNSGNNANHQKRDARQVHVHDQGHAQNQGEEQIPSQIGRYQKRNEENQMIRQGQQKTNNKNDPKQTQLSQQNRLPNKSSNHSNSPDKQDRQNRNNDRQQENKSSLMSNESQNLGASQNVNNIALEKGNQNRLPNQTSMSQKPQPSTQKQQPNRQSNHSTMSNQPQKIQNSNNVQILPHPQEQINPVRNKNSFGEFEEPQNVPVIPSNLNQDPEIGNKTAIKNKVENSEIQQKIQMKPEQVKFLNLLNIISKQNLTAESRSQFQVGSWKESIKNRHCYLTNFFINSELASFGICSPLNDGDYQILYWGVVSGNQKKANFLFKKYVQYLQKFTELDQIYIQSPAFSELGFVKQDNIYVRQRVSIEKKQQSFTPFLEIQCSNICIKQDNDRKHSIFYSQEIQDFKSETANTCPEIARVDQKSLPHLLQETKIHQNLTSMKEVNETLQKYQADTYETSQEINVGNCKLIITMDNFAIKRNEFYIQNGYFMTKGANVFFQEQTKTSIFRMQMQKQQVSMYFGKNFPTINDFLKLCGPQAQGPNKQFAFKMFSKQLYGRLKNQEYLNQGCYANWQIDFVWQDQLKGVITKSLPQPNSLFGPENFFVALFKVGKLLFGFQINSNDYIF